MEKEKIIHGKIIDLIKKRESHREEIKKIDEKIIDTLGIGSRAIGRSNYVVEWTHGLPWEKVGKSVIFKHRKPNKKKFSSYFIIPHFCEINEGRYIADGVGSQTKHRAMKIDWCEGDHYERFYLNPYGSHWNPSETVIYLISKGKESKIIIKDMPKDAYYCIPPFIRKRAAERRK